MSDKGDDRRRFTRRGVCLNRLVEVQIVDDETESITDTHVFLVDVSLGGMRIHSNIPFPELRRFYFILKAAPFSPMMNTEVDEVQFEASVAWQREMLGDTWNIGLEFFGLDKSSESFLAEVLESASQDLARANYRLKKVIGLQASYAGEELYPVTLDLSSSGLRMVSKRDFPLDTLLPLQLFLRYDLPTIELQGRVKWQKKNSNSRWLVGVEFEDLSEEDALVLQDFIGYCMLDEL